jgi:hypothetical protein
MIACMNTLLVLENPDKLGNIVIKGGHGPYAADSSGCIIQYTGGAPNDEEQRSQTDLAPSDERR